MYMQKIMQIHIDKKCVPASIGDTVRVLIPDLDKWRSDPQNALVVVRNGIEECYY